MKVAIIGSGIVGASSAFHIAKKGHEVFLIDEVKDGKATLAGAGILCPWNSRVNDPDWFDIATRGFAYYPEFLEALEELGEVDTGYKQSGALFVSKDYDTIHQLKVKLEKDKEQFPAIGEIKLLQAPDGKNFFPSLHENLHALYISGSARLDGRLLGDALIRAVKRMGTHIVEEKARLKKIRNKAIVVTEKEEITADKIIVATGAWTNEILSPLGLSINVSPQRGQIIHLKADVETSNWPVVLPLDSSHYIVPFDDQRIVFGATREDGTGFDYRMTAGGIHEVLEEGLKVAPNLTHLPIQEIRIGFRPMSDDAKPLLGRLSKLENVVVATGLGSSGLLMGPYVGSLAAKIALNEEINLDLKKFRPDR